MSLRCSILGHSYGETEIEREREEQGSEVVVTVREFEECERCGDRKVVTENKEVTALESPAPDLDSAEDDATTDDVTVDGATKEAGSGATVDAEDGTTVDAGTDANAGGSAGTGANAGGSTGTGATGVPDEGVPADGDDAEILDDSTDSGSSGRPAAGESSASGQSAESSARSGADGSSATERSAGASEADRSGTSPGDAASGTTPGDASSGSASGDAEDAAATGDSAEDADESGPADDDGVILDDDGDGDATGDRTPREWPDADTTHPAETDESGTGDWPDVGREDEGFDAEPGDGERADVEFDGMAATESSSEVADDESEEVEFVNADGDTLEADDGGEGDDELSSGISAGAEAPTLSGPADDPDVDAEFVCPECDYRASVSGSSLRAGDICPECARGYLAQE